MAIPLAPRFRRLAVLTIVIAAAQLMVGLPALATNTVIQQLSGGSRTASLSDATMSAMTYSHEQQSNDQNLTLVVNDNSGTGEGWNVTIQSSNFAYSGLYNGDDIDASNFEITSAADPQWNSGQAIDGSNGPKVPPSNATGSLDVARKVLQADTGYGQGSYSQTLSARLTIPPMARAGSYTAALTVTISAGP